MIIATWNVNSIKQRIEHAAHWLREVMPDIVCLQEIKCVDEAFPAEIFADLGYAIETHGQKTFNGVAILSKHPLEDVTRGLPGDPDDVQARYIEAVVSTQAGALRVGCVYLPNGNPAPGPKYDYKLAFMARLEAHVRERLALEEPFVLAGDFNVIPTPADVHDPVAWAGDALFLPATRTAFRRLLALGLTDALRATSDAPGLYTFWDYQAGAWQRNHGISIDHLLLSPQAADRLEGVAIDRVLRGRERPSDHVPVRVRLAP